MVIFISGGITNIPDYQQHFDKMEYYLKSKGHIPLNPAHFPKGLTNQDYMNFGFQMINSSDAIVMLDGWENSEGAKVENAYAFYLGLPIFVEKQIDELDKFVNNSTQIIETNIFNEREVYKNCTVEIWKNSYNGQISVGWFENAEEWHKVNENNYPMTTVLAYSQISDDHLIGNIDYDIENDEFICTNNHWGDILHDVTHWRELDAPSID